MTTTNPRTVEPVVEHPELAVPWIEPRSTTRRGLSVGAVLLGMRGVSVAGVAITLALVAALPNVLAAVVLLTIGLLPLAAAPGLVRRAAGERTSRASPVVTPEERRRRAGPGSDFWR